MKNIGKNPAMSGVLRKMSFWFITFQILGITENFLCNSCSQMKPSKQQISFGPLYMNKLSRFSFCQECYAGNFSRQVLPICKEYTLIGLKIITERVLHFLRQIWKF